MKDLHFKEDDPQCVLGKGNYGTVYRGTCRGETVAIKILNIEVLCFY